MAVEWTGHRLLFQQLERVEIFGEFLSLVFIIIIIIIITNVLIKVAL